MLCFLGAMIKDKFEDTKEIFRNRKSKDRQNNDQKKNEKRKNVLLKQIIKHQRRMSWSLFLIVFNGFS